MIITSLFKKVFISCMSLAIILGSFLFSFKPLQAETLPNLNGTVWHLKNASALNSNVPGTQIPSFILSENQDGSGKHIASYNVGSTQYNYVFGGTVTFFSGPMNSGDRWSSAYIGIRQSDHRIIYVDNSGTSYMNDLYITFTSAFIPGSSFYSWLTNYFSLVSGDVAPGVDWNDHFVPVFVGPSPTAQSFTYLGYYFTPNCVPVSNATLGSRTYDRDIQVGIPDIISVQLGYSFNMLNMWVNSDDDRFISPTLLTSSSSAWGYSYLTTSIQLTPYYQDVQPVKVNNGVTSPLTFYGYYDYDYKNVLESMNRYLYQIANNSSGGSGGSGGLTDLSDIITVISNTVSSILINTSSNVADFSTIIALVTSIESKLDTIIDDLDILVDSDRSSSLAEVLEQEDDIISSSLDLFDSSVQEITLPDLSTIDNIKGPSQLISSAFTSMSDFVVDSGLIVPLVIALVLAILGAFLL